MLSSVLNTVADFVTGTGAFVHALAALLHFFGA